MPPVHEIERALPDGDTETVFVSPMDVLLTPGAMIRFTTPTAPFEIIVAFIADARQVNVPKPETQLNVLPALIAAIPAIAEMETTLLGGYVTVHWTAAGSLPDSDIRFRLSETVPFDAAVPDDSVKESVCPKHGRNKRTNIIMSSGEYRRMFQNWTLCISTTITI
jgi:hypothetical protein